MKQGGKGRGRRREAMPANVVLARKSRADRSSLVHRAIVHVGLRAEQLVLNN